MSLHHLINSKRDLAMHMNGNDFYKSTSFLDCGKGNIENFYVENHIQFARGHYFFEAGAVNGFHLSQTAFLESEFMFDGVLVEGHADLFRDLDTGGRTALCKNCILGDGMDAIFEQKSVGMIGHSQIREEIINDDCFPCLTLTVEDVLREVDAPMVIDYMVIDVEDGWQKVLKGIDFVRREIDFLAVEMKTEKPKDRLPWINKLMANGMHLVTILGGEDFIFVKR